MTETKSFSLTPSAAVLLSGALIAGAIVFTNTRSLIPGTGTPSSVVNVPAPSAEDHIVGSLSAPVVLIEYSDFQCPFCSMVYPTIKRIVEESNGEVAWIHRNFPLESIHPEARPSAVAAECIAEQLGNDGFWKFAETIYTGDNQKKLGSSYYQELAVQLGASKATFDSCVASEKYGPKIDKETNDAFASGGNGTPFTVIYANGKQTAVSGALPYGQFLQAVNAAR